MKKGANAPFSFPYQDIFPPLSEISFFHYFLLFH